MPTDKKTTEHSARITSPGKYSSFATGEDKGGKGVNFVYGIRKKEGSKGGKSEVQAIRFDAKLWSVKEAKKWLSDHDKKYIKFTAAIVNEDGAPAPAAAPAPASGGPAMTTSNMGATYAPKVFPMASHLGDYMVDRFDQSFMKKMKKSLGESVIYEKVEGRILATAIAWKEGKGLVYDLLSDENADVTHYAIVGYTNSGKRNTFLDRDAFIVNVMEDTDKTKVMKRFDDFVKNKNAIVITGQEHQHGHNLHFFGSENELYKEYKDKYYITEAAVTEDETTVKVWANFDFGGHGRISDNEIRMLSDKNRETFEKAFENKFGETPEEIDTDRNTVKYEMTDEQYDWCNNLYSNFFVYDIAEAAYKVDSLDVSDVQQIANKLGININYTDSVAIMQKVYKKLGRHGKGYDEEIKAELENMKKSLKETAPKSSGMKLGDVVEDINGKQFRIYNISPNWAALIPADTDDKEYSVSDKIMVPIGDLHEFYTKVLKEEENINETARFKSQKEKDEHYAGMKQSYREQLKRGSISQENYDKIMDHIESEEHESIVKEDAQPKDLIIPKDTDPALFDDYVKIYNELAPGQREDNPKLDDLSDALIGKFFGKKDIVWGSGDIVVMDNQIIFKNFSSNVEDISDEEVENEGALQMRYPFLRKMSQTLKRPASDLKPPTPEQIAAATGEHSHKIRDFLKDRISYLATCKEGAAPSYEPKGTLSKDETHLINTIRYSPKEKLIVTKNEKSLLPTIISLCKKGFCNWGMNPAGNLEVVLNY